MSNIDWQYHKDGLTTGQKITETKVHNLINDISSLERQAPETRVIRINDALNLIVINIDDTFQYDIEWTGNKNSFTFATWDKLVPKTEVPELVTNYQGSAIIKRLTLGDSYVTVGFSSDGIYALNNITVTLTGVNQRVALETTIINLPPHSDKRQVRHNELVAKIATTRNLREYNYFPFTKSVCVDNGSTYIYYFNVKEEMFDNVNTQPISAPAGTILFPVSEFPELANYVGTPIAILGMVTVIENGDPQTMDLLLCKVTTNGIELISPIEIHPPTGIWLDTDEVIIGGQATLIL